MIAFLFAESCTTTSRTLPPLRSVTSRAALTQNHANRCLPFCLVVRMCDVCVFNSRDAHTHTHTPILGRHVYICARRDRADLRSGCATNGKLSLSTIITLFCVSCWVRIRIRLAYTYTRAIVCVKVSPPPSPISPVSCESPRVLCVIVSVCERTCAFPSCASAPTNRTMRRENKSVCTK